MNCRTIMALLIDRRTREAVRVQEVLTRHGCIITMRLGLHEAGDVCAEDGLVLLGLNGTRGQTTALARDLRRVRGVRVKTMTLQPR